MSSDCTWFPSDNTLPHTGIEYSATVIYCNLVTQLGYETNPNHRKAFLKTITNSP